MKGSKRKLHHTRR